MVMVQGGVVTAWAIYFADGWSLAIALLVANAVGGFDWFGRVAGMVVTEAPGTRAWQQETSRFASGADLMDLPRSEEHTSELQSLMRISYAVFCLKTKKK